MTTAVMAAFYLTQHLEEIEGRKVAVFNPHNRPVDELSVIYAWNNGGSPGWFHGCLLAEDGEPMGGHICSHEGYMYNDLGVLEGCRPDRHETFKKHYPDGYRMCWVPSSEVSTHPGLSAAYEKHQQKAVVLKKFHQAVEARDHVTP